MSDETPQEPVTPETPVSPETPAEPVAAAPETPAAPVADAAATAPTEETPVADAPPTAAPAAATPPVAAPVAPAATTTATKERKSVAVPMSVLVTLGAIIVAALMFGIGYAVGNSGDDNSSAVTTPIGNGNFPQLPNGNTGNGNTGNGNTQTPNFPQLPGGNQQTPNQNGGNGGNSGNQQTASPPFLGVATQQAQNGLEITEIVSNSAAERAGLQTGDVITEFDGDAVTAPAQLGNAVAQHQVGDRVQVTYTRDGQTKTVTVTLGSRTTSN